MAKKPTFALEVASFLESYEVSQAELAESAGISRGRISQIVNGKDGVTEPVKAKIRAAMDQFANPIGPFGLWLAEARKGSNVSIAELARKSGVSAQAIYFIENGTTKNPSRKTRQLIEDAIIQLGANTEEAPDQKTEKISKKISGLEDFDPHSEKTHPENAGIYIFYDISDRPIYVGKSVNIKKRIKTHMDKFWFRRPIVEKGSFVSINDKELRDQIEKVMIQFMKTNAVINKANVDREDEEE